MGLGHLDRGNLGDRGCNAVVVNGDIGKDVGIGAARAHLGEVMLERSRLLSMLLVMSAMLVLLYDDGANRFSGKRSLDLSLALDVENDDRHVVILAQRGCRGIHDLQAADQHLMVADGVETHCIIVRCGILVVYTAHLGRLDKAVRRRSRMRAARRRYRW